MPSHTNLDHVGPRWITPSPTFAPAPMTDPLAGGLARCHLRSGSERGGRSGVGPISLSDAANLSTRLERRKMSLKRMLAGLPKWVLTTALRA